MKVIPEMSRSH